jgi:4-amino-4-deoxy-L-arabinose transferase-like glycosyltransferase
MNPKILNNKSLSFFNEHKKIVLLSLIIVFSIIVKFLFLSQLTNSIFSVPSTGDEPYYENWGRMISRGDIIGDSVFYGLPGYPYFIGITYWLFGTGIYVIRFAQMSLGIISCFLIYKIGKQFFSETTGLLAAFMFSLYGLFTYYEGHLLSVTLAITLYLLTFFMIFYSLKKRKKIYYLATGILLGLAGLTMSGIFMYIPFVLLGLYFFVGDKKQFFINGVIFCSGILFCVFFVGSA